MPNPPIQQINFYPGKVVLKAGTTTFTFPTETPTTPPLVPSPPPVVVPVATLPPGVKLARDVKNGWGVHVPLDSPELTASAMRYLGTRWARAQFAGDNSSAMLALQAQLPDLRLQVLLNAYLQDADRNQWSAQQGWLTKLFNLGNGCVWAIEGPNEMNNPYVGGGSRGPNDKIDKTDRDRWAQGDAPVANANLVDWAKALASFKPPGGSVEILSPTVVYFLGRDYSPALNVSAYVDYGAFHYYAGVTGTTGVPSYPPSPGNGSRSYAYAQAGLCPGKPMVLSEGGCSTELGIGGYGQDGLSASRYHLMQLLDHHVQGGHRYMIYNLFNNPASVKGAVTGSNEDNFGLFYGDRTMPKPAAVALRTMTDLLSLGLNANDPANLADTKAFTPAYVGSGLKVSGLLNAGTAGSQLVMPKSDGTTMVAIWNEPPIDSGGQSLSPGANPIMVDFGSFQTYAIYDPIQGASSIRSGQGFGTNLVLNGSPLLIELRP